MLDHITHGPQPTTAQQGLKASRILLANAVDPDDATLRTACNGILRWSPDKDEKARAQDLLTLIDGETR